MSEQTYKRLFSQIGPIAIPFIILIYIYLRKKSALTSTPVIIGIALVGVIMIIYGKIFIKNKSYFKYKHYAWNNKFSVGAQRTEYKAAREREKNEGTDEILQKDREAFYYYKGVGAIRGGIITIILSVILLIIKFAL